MFILNTVNPLQVVLKALDPHFDIENPFDPTIQGLHVKKIT